MWVRCIDAPKREIGRWRGLCGAVSCKSHVHVQCRLNLVALLARFGFFVWVGLMRLYWWPCSNICPLYGFVLIVSKTILEWGLQHYGLTRRKIEVFDSMEESKKKFDWVLAPLLPEVIESLHWSIGYECSFWLVYIAHELSYFGF